MQDVVANAATLAAAQSKIAVTPRNNRLSLASQLRTRSIERQRSVVQRKALRTLTAISTLIGNKQIGEAREHR
jgi:hypothetical protein